MMWDTYPIVDDIIAMRGRHIVCIVTSRILLPIWPMGRDVSVWNMVGWSYGFGLYRTYISDSNHSPRDVSFLFFWTCFLLALQRWSCLIHTRFCLMTIEIW